MIQIKPVPFLFEGLPDVQDIGFDTLPQLQKQLEFNQSVLQSFSDEDEGESPYGPQKRYFEKRHQSILNRIEKLRSELIEDFMADLPPATASNKKGGL